MGGVCHFLDSVFHVAMMSGAGPIPKMSHNKQIQGSLGNRGGDLKKKPCLKGKSGLNPNQDFIEPMDFSL